MNVQRIVTRRRPLPVALVWLPLIAGSWGLVFLAWQALSMAAAQGGVGLLAILGLTVLIARTP